MTCPEQGSEMEAVVLRRVGFSAYSCPKQGQDFKRSAAPLYPNMGQVPPREPRVLCLTRFRKQLLLLLQIIQPKDENIISFIKIMPCSRKAQAEKMKCVRKLRVVLICVWFSTDSI